MFIVIEKFGGPFICLNKNGTPMEFETYKKAKVEADDCREAIIVPLNGIDELLDITNYAWQFVDNHNKSKLEGWVAKYGRRLQ